MKIFFDLANFKVFQIIVFGSLYVLGIYYFTLYDDGSHLQTSIVNIQTNNDQVSQKVTKRSKKKLAQIKIFEQEILTQEDVIKTVS